MPSEAVHVEGAKRDSLQEVPPFDLRGALEEARHSLIDITPRP